MVRVIFYLPYKSLFLINGWTHLSQASSIKFSPTFPAFLVQLNSSRYRINISNFLLRIRSSLLTIDRISVARSSLLPVSGIKNEKSRQGTFEVKGRASVNAWSAMNIGINPEFGASKYLVDPALSPDIASANFDCPSNFGYKFQLRGPLLQWQL